MMKAVLWIPLLVLVATAPTHASPAKGTGKEKAKPKAWSMNATSIEACMCPGVSPCYFGTLSAAQADPAAKGKEQVCRFNNAYKINSGTWGAAKLDGAKFWIYGDVGTDFSDDLKDWMVVTFDLATNNEQREGILEIVQTLFPVSWKTYRTAVGHIEWVADQHRAYALLDTGKTAEVRLTGAGKTAKDAPKVENLKYWGAKSNSGFVIMPCAVNAVRRGGERLFEYKKTNGYMVTFDVDSKATASATGGGGY